MTSLQNDQRQGHYSFITEDLCQHPGLTVVSMSPEGFRQAQLTCWIKSKFDILTFFRANKDGFKVTSAQQPNILQN